VGLDPEHSSNRAYSYQVPERGPVRRTSERQEPDGNVVVRTETMSHFGIGGNRFDRQHLLSGDSRLRADARAYPPASTPRRSWLTRDPLRRDPGIGGRIREYRGHELKRLDSPKATLMALITDGILTHSCPWGASCSSRVLTLAIELMGVVFPCRWPSGCTCRLRPSAGMFAGVSCAGSSSDGSRSDNRSLAEIESRPRRSCLASGLIAGGAICGIAVAAIAGWAARAAWRPMARRKKSPLYHTLRGVRDVSHRRSDHVSRSWDSALSHRPAPADKHITTL